MAKPRRGRAASAVPPPGRKPAVAFRLQDKATSNIRAKLDVLVHALKTGTEQPLPTSLRQFNAWQPETMHGLLSERNSQQAMRDRPDLLASVQSALKQLADASTRKQRRPLSESIAGLRREAAQERRLRRIAERQYLKDKLAADQLREKIIELEAGLAATEREGRARIARLSEELEIARASNARLTATLTKVTPLRGSTRGKI